ncbi:MAG: SOS response-associated peptidase [Reichenbachiella sp.]
MIDRYAIYSDFKEINERFGLKGDEFTVPNYNASPSQQLPVIANKSKKGLSFFFWGTNKEWSNNKSISPKLLSADSVQLVQKSIFKTALESRRCIVPVNGFYLWRLYSKKRKTPHYFHNTAENIIALPGIWEEYEDMDGKVNYTFRILEIPNYLGQPEFGDFMPAVLPKAMESKWLDDYSSPDELLEMLNNLEVVKQVTNHPVSPHITTVSNNSEQLIKPQAQVDQLGNYTLFD